MSAYRSAPEKIVGVGFTDIEKVVLMGGNVLALHHIRPAYDIDLVTTPENTDELLRRPGQEWNEKTHVFNRLKDGEPFTMTSYEDTEGEFDVWHQWYGWSRPVGERIIGIDELIENSTQHSLGFYVANLEFVIADKQGSPRQKDQADVILYRKHRSEKE